MMIRAILASVLVLAAGGVVSAAEKDVPVYELRTYYAAPGRLDDLNARFRDHTLELFDKHGLKSIGYWTPVDNTDNVLIYMLAFPSAETREKAWNSFRADPNWKEVREKTEANGRLVIAKKVARDRIISLTDGQARHGRKTQSVRFDGFKLHLLGVAAVRALEPVEARVGFRQDVQ